ncbi:unnamed protein product [Polarella glacialis]|uniref:Uncharacterized protein n=1 Tax=Polarella glacialis TaxID=89957 RepID=A0A813JSH2_POLGL|nr:unnamed protein product [Polarella glacialis]
MAVSSWLAGAACITSAGANAPLSFVALRSSPSPRKCKQPGVMEASRISRPPLGVVQAPTAAKLQMRAAAGARQQQQITSCTQLLAIAGVASMFRRARTRRALFAGLGKSRCKTPAATVAQFFKGGEVFTKDVPALAGDGQTKFFRPEEQVGVLEAIGFFDPLGFTDGNGFWKPVRGLKTVGFGADRGGFGVVEPGNSTRSADELWFRRLREAELKHARVAMLAALGFVVEHIVRVPGFEESQEGIANAFLDERWTRILCLLFIFCGQFERNQFRQEPDREVGDFGNPLKLGQYTTEMRLNELITGRLAMTAVAIIAAVELVTGSPATQVWFPFS